MDCRRRVKRPRLEFQQDGRRPKYFDELGVEIQFIKGTSCLPVIDSKLSCCDAKELTLNRVKLLLGVANRSVWAKSNGVNSFLMKLSQVISGYEDYLNNEEVQEKRKLLEEKDKIRKAAEIQLEEERTKKNLMEKVMLNHLISKEIFQFLSVKDLLNASLVCKCFNEPARLSLRRDKKCFLEINWVKSCDKLEQLTTLLKNSKMIPFNGLHLIYSCSHSCYNHGLVKAAAHADALLEYFTNVKYLKLMEWPVFKNCPIFHIVRKLLTVHSKNLIEISLGSIDSIGECDFTTINDLLRIPVPPPTPADPGSSSLSSSPSSLLAPSGTIELDNLLPNVKTLTLPPSSLTDNTASLVREFIRACPNLQKIIGCVVPKLTEPLVLNKKVDIVREFRFANLTSEEVNLSLKFAQAGAQIEKVIVDSCASRFSTSVTTLRDTLRCLYESSKNSLKILNISHADLLMFFAPFLMPTLVHVKELNLYYNHQYDEQLRWSTVAKIDFHTKFPALDTVKVDRCHSSRFFSDRNDLSQWSDSPDNSSPTVTRLKFNDEGCSRWDSSLVNPFSRVFPNVTHLHINHPAGMPNLFQTLWTLWPHLNTITLTKISDDLIWKNLDSDFTGISEDNCRILRESGKYENYQKMKVKSSITDLKRLKLLRLHIDHDCSKCKSAASKDVFLTQVTAQCAFAPMLLLTVLISLNQCKNLPSGRQCHLTMDGVRSHAQLLPSIHNIVPRGWDLV